MKPPGSGVESDFGLVGDYQGVRGSLVEPLESANSLTINLDEAVCAAARNSQLAELIETQWHAIKCRGDSCDASSLDFLVQGEALEQRNKAAGAAGKLFMGLVEVHLQRELLADSQQHLDDLAETIRIAADEGFATAQGTDELDAGRIRLNSAESKLNTSEQLLNCQLSALINVDSKSLLALRPVYELKPAFVQLDLQAQLELAESNRPGICALESALCNGIQPGEVIRLLLGAENSRLALDEGVRPIQTCLISRVLMRDKESNDAADRLADWRREQLNRVLASRKNQARTAAQVSLIKIQSSLEKLAIANEKIASLIAKAEQLEAKQQLDARGTYLDIHQNRVELQTAKSERISSAIEHDTAIIELLEAQGLLLTKCGFLCQEPVTE